MDGTVPQTGFLPGRNRQNAEKQLPGRASASGLAGKRGFFANLTCEQGFRPRSLRHGGLRRPLRSTRLGTDPVEHREAILRKKGRLNALRAAFLARLSAREAFRFSGTCLRAQPQPFLRRSSHGLYFASQSCIALPCRRQLFLDLYLFFLVRLFYVCGRRTYLASNASSSVPSSSFSIRSGASRKRLVKR